ncbi:MAG: NUDIX domain-containing protein [Alphaproteobacteria bacterium]|jgi:ADP-ribose pyrophosphatase YjhB (NUDIX family)
MQTHAVKLIVTVSVVADDRVLMVEPVGGQDGESGWFLPNELMNELEHPEHAAHRVLDDGLGLEGIDVALSHMESFTGGDGTWHLAFHYVARFDDEPDLTLSKRFATAEWFTADSLPARDEVAHGGWALGVIRKVLR